MSETEMTASEQREALMKAERKAKKEIAKTNQVLSALAIEYVRIDEIKPNPWNPNRQSEHDFELLMRSMEEDGFTQPVVCVRLTEDDFEDDRIKNAGTLAVGDVMIVDGEHRWRAASRLGYETIPVAIAPMGAVQARIATLRHNRARGSEDIELAADVLRDLEALGAKEWGLDSLGMDEMEWDRLIEDISAPEALADEEHGQAWEPDSGVDPEGEELSVEARVGLAPSGEWLKAATPAAVDAARDRETALAAAKTDEQRRMVQRDTAREFHRVSLVFAGEEGKLVKDVLGGAPAEKLAEMCRVEAGAEAKLKEDGWVLIDSVIGGRMIPAEVAAVLVEAREKMNQAEGTEGAIGKRNGFQLLEYLAAEYLAQ